VLLSDAPEGQVPHYVMRAWEVITAAATTSPVPGVSCQAAQEAGRDGPLPDRTSLDLICHVDDRSSSRPGRSSWPFWKKIFPTRQKSPCFRMERCNT